MYSSLLNISLGRKSSLGQVKKGGIRKPRGTKLNMKQYQRLTKVKNIGRNKKPRDVIPTPVLIIPQGVLFGREEYYKAKYHVGGFFCVNLERSAALKFVRYILLSKHKKVSIKTHCRSGRTASKIVVQDCGELD